MTNERVFTKDLEGYFRIGKKQAERLFVQIRGHCGIEKFGIVRWSHVKEFEQALNKGLLRKGGRSEWNEFKIQKGLYEAKKYLWEQDRNYYKIRGADCDFESVMDGFFEYIPSLKEISLNVFFSKSDDEFRDLFDEWFVRSEANRLKQTK